MAFYRTRQNDVLDLVCLEHYGRESAVTDVLAANPGLSSLGAILDSGLVIELPELPDETQQQDNIKLWD